MIEREVKNPTAELAASLDRAGALANAGNPDEALRVLRPLVAEHRENPDLLSLSGFCFERKGDLPRAIYLYKESAKHTSDPTMVAKYISRAEKALGEKVGQMQGAKPGSALWIWGFVLLFLGGLLLAVGLLPEARDILETVFSADLALYQIHLTIAGCAVAGVGGILALAFLAKLSAINGRIAKAQGGNFTDSLNRPCWSCELTYLKSQNACPYCDSPRTKPRQRDFARLYRPLLKPFKIIWGFFAGNEAAKVVGLVALAATLFTFVASRWLFMVLYVLLIAFLALAILTFLTIRSEKYRPHRKTAINGWMTLIILFIGLVARSFVFGTLYHKFSGALASAGADNTSRRGSRSETTLVPTTPPPSARSNRNGNYEAASTVRDLISSLDDAASSLKGVESDLATVQSGSANAKPQSELDSGTGSSESTTPRHQPGEIGAAKLDSLTLTPELYLCNRERVSIEVITPNSDTPLVYVRKERTDSTHKYTDMVKSFGVDNRVGQVPCTNFSDLRIIEGTVHGPSEYDENPKNPFARMEWRTREGFLEEKQPAEGTTHWERIFKLGARKGDSWSGIRGDYSFADEGMLKDDTPFAIIVSTVSYLTYRGLYASIYARGLGKISQMLFDCDSKTLSSFKVDSEFIDDVCWDVTEGVPQITIQGRRFTIPIPATAPRGKHETASATADHVDSRILTIAEWKERAANGSDHPEAVARLGQIYAHWDSLVEQVGNPQSASEMGDSTIFKWYCKDGFVEIRTNRLSYNLQKWVQGRIDTLSHDK